MKQNDIRDNVVPLLGTYNFEQVFNVYTDPDGYYFYNLLKNVYFPDGIDPSLFQTIYPQPGELLPQLSFRVYGVVNLWWIIAGINNIYNTLESLDPSTKLKIINSSTIRSILATIRED